MRRLSHPSQAPEGTPLPRQGPGQGVVVQPPGSGSRSRAMPAVVSAMIASPSIREEGERGGSRSGSFRIATWQCRGGGSEAERQRITGAPNVIPHSTAGAPCKTLQHWYSFIMY